MAQRSTADVIVAAQQAIRRLMKRGAPFRTVEELITHVDALNDEQKAALWLYAWALQPERVLARETRATLELVASD
jgi:hypothetical protein